jgi:hypothetical protein
MVQNKWIDFKKLFPSGSYSLNRWHGYLQKLRLYLKGWNLNFKGEQKVKREKQSKGILKLDLIAESRLLSIFEVERKDPSGRVYR